MKTFLSLFIVSFLLVGCAGAPVVPTSRTPTMSQLPAWAMNPPADDADWIYGVGSAVDIAGAEKQALAAIAGKLNSEIISETKVQITEHNGVSDQQFSAVTSAKVETTELNHFQVQRRAQQGKDFWVLVALSRDAFFKNQYEKLVAMDARLVALMKDFYKSSALKQFVLSEKSNQLLAESNNKVSVVGLSKYIDHGKYATRYAGYQTDIRRARDQLKLMIKGESAAAQLIRRQVMELLSAAGTVFVATGSADGLLTVNSQVQHSVDGDADNITLITHLKTQDANGLILANKEYRTTSRSYNGYEAALKSSAQSVYFQLKTLGIIEGLGLSNSEYR